MSGASGVVILLRHGETDWNAGGRFTGWVDVPLSVEGEKQARQCGRELLATGPLPDVAHTSLLRRSVMTASLVLDEADRHWIPVRRDWRLNERHYGALQGRSKAQVLDEVGRDQYMAWRRSQHTAPPPIADGDEFHQAGDPRYAALGAALPRSESLGDVTARLVPYWESAIVPDLRAGRTVLVVAHGNLLRALLRHLRGLSDEAVAALDIPICVPMPLDLHLDGPN
ncbi:2,3-bisphosphoglycerate-dependent phosphoglycerate mutase [Acrocarpospora catenulata]|uniref:2,3-bisphosphoglycerate-dependent phosphoglycerate mutase n=1 Tax=Acrocarpospora catenulata TaxID=2836182 RepID=UPI001BD9DFDE|nr:2,3-bisphosphoglycerate-dependent phosphoglycerate mutase [Acrocarpospora catenulata]